MSDKKISVPTLFVCHTGNEDMNLGLRIGQAEWRSHHEVVKNGSFKVLILM